MTGRPHRIVATFSIVAYDPATGELGVGVESKFLAVGAVVPWARAGVGAVATQAWGNTSYGPEGLQLLAEGKTPQDVLTLLTEADENGAERQAGIVDAQGRAATYTGSGCMTWAGGRTGPNYAAQGNILAGEAVIAAVAQTFEANAGLRLPERIVAALQAGQAAGGDRRGQQSAALLVVKDKGGYGGFNDRYIDLRVDDHPQPIDELARLLGLYRVYFAADADADMQTLTPELTTQIQQKLVALGYMTQPPTGNYDATTRVALRAFCDTENLEERWNTDPESDQVDAVIIDFVLHKTG